MATGIVKISGSVVNLPDGPKTIAPPPIYAGAAVGDKKYVTLQSGDNTISVPSGATGCVIVPDPTNTVTLKTKNQAGDSGEPIGIAIPCLKTFNGQSSFIINAASTLSTLTEIDFF